MKKLKEAVARHEDYVIAMRRHFHMYPELGGAEFDTQKKIMEELAGMGLKPRMTAGTGIVADLKGALPGKTIALRADIDALPIQDEIETSYRSKKPGVCHACGHDGHAAMLLGAAKVLTELKDEMKGNVRFLFQPSEEKFPSGALAMVEAGAMAGVDFILGIHLWQPLSAGIAGISYGCLMASPDEFTITVQGKGGHGSMPQDTVCALSVGAQIICSLNTIVGRAVDPLDSAVISPGMFRSGEVFNITPDNAVIKGTIRSFNAEVRSRMWKRLEEICNGICQAGGATYTMEKNMGHPPVINNSEVSSVVAEAAGEAVGNSNVREIAPSMGGEDFSFFLQHAPGMFLFLGIGNPAKGASFPHHHPRFDMDESVLAAGVEVMVRSVCKLQN